ncbi:MAG: hypothetical protein AAF206_19020 [Bacteroidota bacterium]
MKKTDEDLRKIVPFLKTWRQLYIIILVELVVLIGLFYLFSQAYA